MREFNELEVFALYMDWLRLEMNVVDEMVHDVEAGKNIMLSALERGNQLGFTTEQIVTAIQNGG